MGLTHLYASIHQQEIISMIMCTNFSRDCKFRLRSHMEVVVSGSPYSKVNNVPRLRERNSSSGCLLPFVAGDIATRKSSYQY